MAEFIRQSTFKTGEVDQITWKRTDAEEYLSSAQSLLNLEIGTTGVAKKRRGTEFLGNVTQYAVPTSHLYDFVDNNNIHYLLMSSNKSFYVFNTPVNTAQVVTLNGAEVITGRGTTVVAGAPGIPFVQEITGPPYLTTELDEIDYTQDNDSLILTHPNHSPARIFISSYVTIPPTFAFEYLDIYPLPAYDFNKINYNNFNVSYSVSSQVITFQFTGVGADPGFNSAWIGGQILGGGTDVTSPLGYAIITNVSYSSSGGGTVTFTGLVQVPFASSNIAPTGSQYSIRQPAWTDALGWPGKVLFFQNRLWMANTKTLPSTIFGSRINSPTNYDVGTGEDTDAIIYTVGETDSGDIIWMNDGKQLEVYCQNDEFVCPQDQNSALTPSTFSIRKQSSYGVSPNLKPVNYINDSYYASKTGRSFINFHFNGVGLAYVATNISAASSHLVKNPNNRALQRGSDSSQDNFIYYLNSSDNTITTFQFASESKLAALTPCEFQEGISLIDIVTIDNEIFILKFYSNTNTYAIERFNDSMRIDSYFQASMQMSGLVTGLDIFNGYIVQVVFQNQDLGVYLVVNGQIMVDNMSGQANSVFIGLLYDVELIPMYPFAGASASPLMKQLTRIYVDYFESLDFTINGKLVPYQNFADIQAGLPLQPQTDTAIISPVLGWNRNVKGENDAIVIRQSSPFDLQILGISYQIDVAVI